MTGDQNVSQHKCKCSECKIRPRSEVAREHRAINRVMFGLNELNRRRFGGMLAIERGRGGIQLVHEITGLSRMTIRRGRDEVLTRSPGSKKQKRVREHGAGRESAEKNNP
jgi:hypothetical protein